MADEECLSGSVDDFGVRVSRSLTIWMRRILAKMRSTRRRFPFSDPADGRKGGGMGDGVVGCARRDPAGEDGGEFFGCEVAVFVGEADATLELRFTLVAYRYLTGPRMGTDVIFGDDEALQDRVEILQGERQRGDWRSVRSMRDVPG